MITIPEKCYEEKAHKGEKLVCKENKRQVIFTKPMGKTADKIRVDGCMLCQQIACDYLVIDWKGRHHFVELKGSDVEHALEQIGATVLHFKDAIKAEPFWCLIACTKVPPVIRASLQNSRLKFTRKWKKAEIKIKADTYVHVLS